MSTERRQHSRHIPSEKHILYYADSHQTFGTVANISTGGFLLLTPDKIEDEAVLSLTMKIKKQDAIMFIPFSVICLWQSKANTQNNYWSGLHIIDIKQEDEALLSDYIQAMKIAT